VELNRGLCDRLDDNEFSARVRATTSQLGELAAEIVDCACAECPGIDAAAVKALLPQPAARGGSSMLFAAA
jgi:hypothetical protein